MSDANLNIDECIRKQKILTVFFRGDGDKKIAKDDSQIENKLE